MQQSAAFKILRTRLKTVPSYAVSIEQLKHSSSGNPYSQILQIMEDNKTQDAANVCNAINFPARLQQFEQMQRRHRVHSKSHLMSLNTTSSAVSQVCGVFQLVFPHQSVSSTCHVFVILFFQVSQVPS